MAYFVLGEDASQRANRHGAMCRVRAKQHAIIVWHFLPRPYRSRNVCFPLTLFVPRVSLAREPCVYLRVTSCIVREPVAIARTFAVQTVSLSLAFQYARS